VGAFGDLYDEYALTVCRYLYSQTSSGDLAEALTSETFSRVLDELDTWSGPGFSAMLMAIARNVVVDHDQGQTRLAQPT
jgi:RNA polymerase sigma-70 factor (ECF subfamily)